MMQMVKRDFYGSGLYTLLLLLIVPFYAMNAPNLVGLFYVYVIFFYVFFTFNADYKSKINKFLVSLPIERKRIVASRYLFSLVSVFLLFVFHYFVDSFIYYWLPNSDFEPLTALKIVSLVATFLIVLSISIPLYYLFKSFMRAFYVHLTLFFLTTAAVGTVINNPYIDLSKVISRTFGITKLHPYILLLLFSSACLYGSYRLSVWLFAKRDI